VTITAPIIRALEQLARGEPVAPLLRKRMLGDKLAEETDILVLTPIGRAILQAYRIGRRRWGAR